MHLLESLSKNPRLCDSEVPAISRIAESLSALCPTYLQCHHTTLEIQLTLAGHLKLKPSYTSVYWNSHFRKRHYKAAASDCHRSALQCKSLNIEPTEPRLSQGSGSEEVKINVAAWCCLFHLVPNLHRIFGKVAACLSTPYSQLWRRVFQADHAFS